MEEDKLENTANLGKENKSTEKKRIISWEKLVTAAIGGVIVYFGTVIQKLIKPLEPKWPEKVEIEILPSNEDITIGQDVSIDLLIQSRGKSNISNGTLNIDYNKSDFELISGENKTSTNTIEYSKRLDLDITLRSKRTGKLPIYSNLKTSRDGIYLDTLILDVRDGIGIPTKYNWTGEWSFKLGVIGKLFFSENKQGGLRKLSGHYSLGLEKGNIAGVRDGTTFHVTLVEENNETEKKELDGDFEFVTIGNEHYIEIKGEATFYEIGNGEWKQTGKKESFVISSQLDK